jgi:hypothetical protein
MRHCNVPGLPTIPASEKNLCIRIPFGSRLQGTRIDKAPGSTNTCPLQAKNRLLLSAAFLIIVNSFLQRPGAVQYWNQFKTEKINSNK